MSPGITGTWAGKRQRKYMKPESAWRNIWRAEALPAIYIGMFQSPGPILSHSGSSPEWGNFCPGGNCRKQWKNGVRLAIIGGTW